MRSLESEHGYMSITGMEWKNIPRFVVLTGPNGAGKSHFLKMVASSLGAVLADGLYVFSAGTCELDPKPRATAYLGANWSVTDPTVTHQMFEPIRKYVDHVTSLQLYRKRTSADDPTITAHALASFVSSLDPDLAVVARALADAGELDFPVSPVDILRKLGPYALVHRNPGQPLETLAQLFYAHVNYDVTQLLSGVPHDEVLRASGRAPWHLANELLALFGLRYTLPPPTNLQFTFELKCLDASRHIQIAPSELSSGEQAILAIVATLVTTAVLNAAQNGMTRFADLLLLDEPDAHLHTSMIERYLGQLRGLSETYDMQIIMVTHRPDTIALAPEGSLFELTRANERTHVVPRRATALISRLTEDRLSIIPGVRIVLVEDEDDRRFHQWAYEQLLAWQRLRCTPRLVFMPVNAKGGGGRGAVAQRLELMRREGLGAFFTGLVDGDGLTEAPPPGVVRTKRYALENYLAEPIALYCGLSVNREVDARLNLGERGGLRVSEFHRLATVDFAELQKIADVLLEVFESNVRAQLGPSAIQERTDVDLLRGNSTLTLRYPRWLLTHPAKQLLSALNTCVDRACSELMHNGPQLAGLVPKDLCESYAQLLADDVVAESVT